MMKLVNPWSTAAFAVLTSVGAGNYILSESIDERLVTSVAKGERGDRIVQDCSAKTLAAYSNGELARFGGVMLWPAVTKCVADQKRQEIAEIRDAGTVAKILRPSPEGGLAGAGLLAVAAMIFGAGARLREGSMAGMNDRSQGRSPTP